MTMSLGPYTSFITTSYGVVAIVVLLLILWIAVDSLRPDHIDPTNTPNLAALLSESIYFPNAITPVVPSSGYGRLIEPLLVAGIVASLISLFYSNR